MASQQHLLVDTERPLVALTNEGGERVKHKIAPAPIKIDNTGSLIRPPACDPTCEEHSADDVLVIVSRDKVARTTRECSTCYERGGGL